MTNRQSSFHDYARVTDPVVQGSLFVVERRHDIADEARKRADHFSKIASQAAQIGNAPTLRSNDLDLASHFAKGRSVLPNEYGLVRQTNGDLNDEQSDLDGAEAPRLSSKR